MLLTWYQHLYLTETSQRLIYFLIQFLSFKLFLSYWNRFDVAGQKLAYYLKRKTKNAKTKRINCCCQTKSEKTTQKRIILELAINLVQFSSSVHPLQSPIYSRKLVYISYVYSNMQANSSYRVKIKYGYGQLETHHSAGTIDASSWNGSVLENQMCPVSFSHLFCICIVNSRSKLHYIGISG